MLDENELEEFIYRSLAFVATRGWEGHENKETLLLCILEELGELTGAVKYMPPGNKWSTKEYGRLVSETADVFIFLVRFYYAVKKSLGEEDTECTIFEQAFRLDECLSRRRG